MRLGVGHAIAAEVGPLQRLTGRVYVHDVELDGDEDLGVGDRDGAPAREAVSFVRQNYHPRAVETPWQPRYVRQFVS
jgi:hypothetical protein